jgi:hypothetical protein
MMSLTAKYLLTWDNNALMFELILIIAAAIVIGRFAETDRSEGLKWGAITFGICLVSLLIPLPYLRVLLACGATFFAMTAAKKTFY